MDLQPRRLSAWFAVMPARRALRGLSAWFAEMSARRVLLIVFIAAAVLRLWALGTLPLILTNDSIDYVINGAISYYEGNPDNLPKFRTPGYPLIVLASFHIFGLTSVGVLIVQHAMGCLTALMVTSMALRFARPAWALIPGLFCALDPTLLAFECLALTEAPTVFLFVLAAWLVLRAVKHPIIHALSLGAVLAYMALVRPTNQALAPFFFFGIVLLPGLTLWKRATVAAAVFAGFAAVSGPWIAYNADRQVKGFARGFGAALWVSLVQQDLLQRDFPLPPRVDELFEPVRREHGATQAMWDFIASPEVVKAAKDVGWSKLQMSWAISSIVDKPGAYIERMGYSLLWQLNYYPEGGFIPRSQIRWLTWLVSCDSDVLYQQTINFRFDGPTWKVYFMGMSGRNGPLREFMGWWGINYAGGIPQIPLCILAVTATFIALRRRDWPLFFVLLASGALVGVHVVMIFHQSRYSVPSMTFWYATSLIAPMALAGVVSSRRAAQAAGRAEKVPAAASPPSTAIATTAPIAVNDEGA